jgi:bifunctional non-homologous end joining protein LigD
MRASNAPLPVFEARFIEPMECLPVSKLYEGDHWLYEIKLDGYRAIAVKANGKISLFSRNRKSFNHKFPRIAKDLEDLPDDTVIDGEVIAISDSGRPDFNLLQNFRSEAARIHYLVFDVLILKGRDLTRLPLIQRREFLRSLKFELPVTRIDYIEASAADMLHAAKTQKLEGVIAKRKDSVYEPGLRSGAWIKYRLNLGQELVIGGYTPGPHGIDAIIVGYYKGRELVYVARVRNGFVPASRRSVFAKIGKLKTSDCPFANLPETHKPRWGHALDAEKMKECVWVKPEIVAQIEYLEWTESDHLRHASFAGLREDKDAPSVVKERAGES